MGLSTERKVFLGLFLVAGGAFLMDQAILGPSGAEASVVDLGLDLSSESILAIGTQVQSPSKSQATAASLLNERLANLTKNIDQDSSLNQLFSDPMLRAIESPTEADAAAVQSTPVVAVQLPKLSAVMPSQSGGAAVIDGVLIRAGGESAAGFRLITVQKRSVILEKSGNRYTIEVPVLGG
ncbi:MAG: hypothetical protein JKY96_03650 [Phycisphaerales bacterium]|nr:hypothetical protein [Phycisphaerales bacterium]